LHREETTYGVEGLCIRVEKPLPGEYLKPFPAKILHRKQIAFSEIQYRFSRRFLSVILSPMLDIC